MVGLGCVCDAKSRGGLGFKNLFGFNVALLDGHILEAGKGAKASFIWTSIWKAKEFLSNSFRWVIGDGQSVVATRDSWLAQKPDYKVDKLQMYEGRNETVSTLFHPGTKFWDSDKIHELFSDKDAKAILATGVPQRHVVDRIVWSKSTDGLYNVKTGYREWHNQFAGNSRSIQSCGWSRLWSGDDEQLLHLFFVCPFASSCWHAINLNYDMEEVLSARHWVLNKLETEKHEEVVGICVALWGIWFWHNKRVWNNQMVNPAIAMENSFRILWDWKAARQCVQPGIGSRVGDRFFADV